MESSFLSEGCNTSILRTGLSSATTVLSTGYRPLGSCSRAAGWSAATLCVGTFETCRPILPMSVHRGRPEVGWPQVKTALMTHLRGLLDLDQRASARDRVSFEI